MKNSPLFAGLFACAFPALCLGNTEGGSTQVTPNITTRNAPSNFLVIDIPVGGDRIRLTAERYFAGAITSINYRGEEYIKTETNRFGIELQSAASFDDLGECFNPTEAGGRYDNRRAAGSSSVLLDSRVGTNTIETTSKMAFWWPPNEKYFSPRGNFCGVRKDIDRPAYKDKLSDFILRKKVTVNTITLNVDGKQIELPWLDYQITLSIPSNHESGTIEAVTAYLPAEFTLHYSYDPEQNKGVELLPGKPRGMSMQELPVILATQDKRHAMGVYAVPRKGQIVSYGSYKFPEDTNKWNCLFREKDIVPGLYHYRCLIAVGNIGEVEQVMKGFYDMYGRETRTSGPSSTGSGLTAGIGKAGLSDTESGQNVQRMEK